MATTEKQTNPAQRLDPFALQDFKVCLIICRGGGTRSTCFTTKQAHIFRLALEELGHLQPPTPINCDNKTAVGICNGTVKRQRSRLIEMRYFWVGDQVKNGVVNVQYAPGAKNMGD
jgi:hypothetical protein